MDLKKIIEDTVATDWRDILLQFDTTELDKFLTTEKKTFDGIFGIFPEDSLIFRAFTFFNFAETKVVILGKSPPAKAGKATGLAYSSNGPMSTTSYNIYGELRRNLIQDIPNMPFFTWQGDLSHWAEQGILLLNMGLTVREGKLNSHQKKWEKYTDRIIKYISDHGQDIVFILWGKDAKSKKKLIDCNKHHIIEGENPGSPNAWKGFKGTAPFSKTNIFLEKVGKKPINWVS